MIVLLAQRILLLLQKEFSKSSSIPALTNKLLFSGKDQPICFGYSGNISTGRIDRATYDIVNAKWLSFI